MIQGGAEAFTKAFIAKLCLNALMLLMSLKKVWKSDARIMNALKMLLNKYSINLPRTNIRLGIFMGL